MIHDNSIMHEADWKKDGETGCLMSLVKIGAATVVLALVAALAFTYGTEALVNLWWS